MLLSPVLPDNTNVSITEYSNLDDDDNTLSVQNKLEISNEVSISEANIVNSQNDNLGDYSSNDVLSSSKLDDNLQTNFVGLNLPELVSLIGKEFSLGLFLSVKNY